MKIDICMYIEIIPSCGYIFRLFSIAIPRSAALKRISNMRGRWAVGGGKEASIWFSMRQR